MTGQPDRALVVNFLCDTFNLLPSEFEVANLEKRKAIQEEGINDLEFWLSMHLQSKSFSHRTGKCNSGTS